MKKIILILFLFLSCYLIYNLTENENTSYLLIGDQIVDNKYLKNTSSNDTYNNNFINKDYRIIDLINVIKYNEEKEINNKPLSIHRLLKNSDILIISIGMNDIYYKLNSDTKNIYRHINEMVNNMEILLEEINRYDYEQVLVMGYYNITNQNNDLFTYLNYKMKRVVEKYSYQYIELDKIIKNNPLFLEKTNNFMLNDKGYNEISKIIVEKFKKS